MHGFQDCVHAAWNRAVPPNQNSLKTMHIKLSRVAKALKLCVKGLIPAGKLIPTVCREVIG
jgi:hypothetical protein